MRWSVLESYVVSQAGRPRGPLGSLLGRIMAQRPANRRRNAWTVDLLGLQASHRVLEIGHGPGLALQLVVQRVGGGGIVGLDHSATMGIQAARRNRAPIAEGRLRLLVGSIEDPGYGLEGPFDRIFGVNVAMFWKDPAAVFARLKGLLAPGGVIAFTHQPRAGRTADAEALRAAEGMKAAMAEAGLDDIRLERLAGLSPLAVCVIGGIGAGRRSISAP